MIDSKASINYTEISLHYGIINDSKFRLDIGGGFGLVSPELNLLGKVTSKTFKNNDSQVMMSFAVDVTIKEFVHKNLSFRMGYQYRNSSYGSKATDTFYPYDDLTLSSMNFSLLASF